MGHGAHFLRINVSNYWILASICYTKKNLEILILDERLGFNQTKAKRTLELRPCWVRTDAIQLAEPFLVEEG